MAELITVKITDEARQDIKMIAAKKKEKFYETLARIARAERKRLKLVS